MASKYQGSEFTKKSIKICHWHFEGCFKRDLEVIQINSSQLLKIVKEKHSSKYPSVRSQFIRYTFFCKDIQPGEILPMFLNLLISSQKLLLKCCQHSCSIISCFFSQISSENGFRKPSMFLDVLNFLAFEAFCFYMVCSYKKSVVFPVPFPVHFLSILSQNYENFINF